MCQKLHAFKSFSILDPDLMTAYVRSLEEGTFETCRARLMFVGHYKVGKTSVVRSLLGLPFVEEHVSTDGIETRTAETEKSLDIIEATDWKQADDSTAEITENEFQNEVVANLKRGVASGTLSRSPFSVKQKQDHKKIPDRSNLSRTNSETAANTFPVTDRDLFHLGNIQLKSEMKNKPEKSFNRRFSMFDFAGQVEFYATHHLFVNRKAVYILVLDTTQSLDMVIESKLSGRFKMREAAVPKTVREFVAYWLKTIHTQSYRNQKVSVAEAVVYPKVVIVLTHKDKIVSQDKDQYIQDYWKSLMKCIDGKVYADNVYTRERFVLDNKNGDPEEIKKLKHALQKIANDQCQWGLRRPVRWLKLESDIHIKARQQNKDYLRVDLVEKLSGRYSMSKELDDFLRYHHEIGDLLYFPHGSHTLAEYVITNPQWLTNVFYTVITAPVHQ